MMRRTIANIPTTNLSGMLQRTRTPFRVLPSSNRPNLFSGD